MPEFTTQSSQDALYRKEYFAGNPSNHTVSCDQAIGDTGEKELHFDRYRSTFRERHPSSKKEYNLLIGSWKLVDRAPLAKQFLTPDQPYGRNLPPSQLLLEMKKSPAIIMKTQTTRLTTFRTLLKPTVLRTPRAITAVTTRAMNKARTSRYVSSPLPETEGQRV